MPWKRAPTALMGVRIMTKTRVVVVDDHEAVRHSLCELVQSSFPEAACLEASNGEEAVELAAAHRADAAAAGAYGYVAKIDLGRELVPVIRRHLEAADNGDSATGPDRIKHDRPAVNGEAAP